MIKNKGLKADLLTSSPRANGFYKSGFVKKHIPGMYRANEYNLLKKNKGNVRIFEYEKGEWTFHAKGAWVYETEVPSPELPVMTIIGSSNFSQRSNRRDTECQLYMVSDSLDFRKRLKEESDSLFKQSEEVTMDKITGDKEDPLGWTDRILSRLFISYL